MNDLHTTPLSDQDFCRIIIRSIIPTDNWMPILPSLYMMPTSSNIISHLQNALLRLSVLQVRAQPNPRLLQPELLPADVSTQVARAVISRGTQWMIVIGLVVERRVQFPPNFGCPRCANYAIQTP